MSALTKTHHTEVGRGALARFFKKRMPEEAEVMTRSLQTIIVEVRRHHLTHSEKAELVANLVRDILDADEGDPVPAEQAFKDLTAKYGKAGVAIRGARNREGITQEQLAKRLGIKQGNLSKMENGKRPIGKAMAKRLAKELRVDYRLFLA